jgi:hypothetical protein
MEEEYEDTAENLIFGKTEKWAKFCEYRPLTCMVRYL